MFILVFLLSVFLAVDRAMSPAQSEDSGLAPERGTTYATITLPRNALHLAITFAGEKGAHPRPLMHLKWNEKGLGIPGVSRYLYGGLGRVSIHMYMHVCTWAKGNLLTAVMVNQH